MVGEGKKSEAAEGGGAGPSTTVTFDKSFKAVLSKV